MANGIDDFLKILSGGSTVDDKQATQFHERFVSTKPEDNQFDNNVYQEAVTDQLGALPDDQFQNIARNAIAQTPPQERQDLLGTLLGALSGAGVSGMSGLASGGGLGGSALSGLAKMLGLGSTDPSQMSDDDAAKVMNHVRHERPELIRQTVAEKPWFVKALGNPIVMGALAMAATRLLSRRR